MPKPTAVAEKTKRSAKVKIYKVEINGEVKLVRTTTRAKAIKNFTKDIVASIPSVDELVELIKADVSIEDIEG